MEHIPSISFLDDSLSRLVAVAGGKGASLSYLRTLSCPEWKVPDGFVITTAVFNACIKKYRGDFSSLSWQTFFDHFFFDDVFTNELEIAYKKLISSFDGAMAVRSSSTAEDAFTTSFAGQHATFLEIDSFEAMVSAVKKCMASYFSESAVAYRKARNMSDHEGSMAVIVQKMVGAAVSGITFGMDTASGFDKVIHITAFPGYGEAVVSGAVVPDEYYLHKATLASGKSSLLKKKKSPHSSRFCLNEEQVFVLGKVLLYLEEKYREILGKQVVLDCEWSFDKKGHLFLLQTRPETTFSKKGTHLECYTVHSEGKTPLLEGLSIGQKAYSGRACVISSLHEASLIQEGDILVTGMTAPDWEPHLGKVKGIITDKGGRTCHGAIVSRERGIPAVVGSLKATQLIKHGQIITLDCTKGDTGYVYDGQLFIEKQTRTMSFSSSSPVQQMINLGQPDKAFSVALLPHDGIGLARIEFIISHAIKAHPMALLHPEKINNLETKEQIISLIFEHVDGADFFVSTLASHLALLAASAHPRPVIVRFSDFKSNEYKALLGGEWFEPSEENPMLGLRGASRYYHSSYQEAFLLECRAIQKVRSEMGFSNVHIMIPFVRTPQELLKVIDILHQEKLFRGHEGLQLYLMCELPSNVILLDSFLPLVDGVSIGSNDLTQMILGVDREAEHLSFLFDEMNEAVTSTIAQVIRQTKKAGKKVSICGQAPSDNKEFASFLIGCGIDAISYTPDAFITRCMQSI